MDEFLKVFDFWRCKSVHRSELLPDLVVLGDWEPFLKIGGEFFSFEVGNRVPRQPVEVRRIR